jgi:integrase
MARQRKDSRITSRSSRTSLSRRSEPYWVPISKGLAVGYRKGKSGTWIARHFTVDTGRRIASLGVADDFIDADGISTLSFDQAQAAARAWLKRLAQEDAGDFVATGYTVEQLMADYLKDRQTKTRKKPEQMARTRSVINVHILPTLGKLQLSKLTHSKVKAWRDTLAEAAPLVRAAKGETLPRTREMEANEENIRKRHATANRIFTVLRAALNFAYSTNKISTKAAWEKIKPFGEVDAPKLRYLTLDECNRLIDACSDDFRRLVRAVLYTGCRYGELIAMPVSAFDPVSDTIHVRKSKSCKPRFIALSDEGAAFFQSIIEGKSSDELMFTHDSGVCEGESWKPTQQRYWMDEACKAAKIKDVSFHTLRHSYASQLAMNNTPLPVIGKQLGHADSRMTERYAHLGKDYVTSVVKANLPSFGFAVGPQLVQRSA